MTENSRTVAVLKGQISKFSGIISKGFSKPKRKLIKEVIYGIQAAKDIKLSHITRALNESIPLIKTRKSALFEHPIRFYPNGFSVILFLPSLLYKSVRP